MTGELTNLDRAQAASDALEAFTKSMDLTGEDVASRWRDLVTNLLHFADLNGMDTAEELRKAADMARVEREEDRQGLPEPTARFLSLADLLAAIEQEGGGIRWNTERLPAIENALALLPEIYGFAWKGPIHHGTGYLLAVQGETRESCGAFPPIVREAFRSIRHGTGEPRYWRENQDASGWTYTDHWGAAALVRTIAAKIRANLFS